MTHDTDFIYDPYVPEFMNQARAREHNATALSRRGFIKVSGAAGGGLVLGLSLSGCGGAQESTPGTAGDAATASDTIFEANPYVQVRPDNTVVIYSKNPDVGQGVKTAMPMIVAEELDADWSQVVVLQADIDQNRYGQQIAGGSTSIPSNWMPLRQAGASARAMLVAAAAIEFGVDASELSTDAGFVIHQGSGRRMPYGDLANRAATLPVPDAASLPLKDRSEWKLLGKRVTGVDNLKIVTGQPLYGIDQHLPDMVYATLVKAATIGARPVSANLDHVKSLPGIRDAFLVEGVGNPIEIPMNAAAVLPGVAIIANSTWAAFKAKDELEVDWDTSDAATDSWSDAVAQAMELGATDGAESLADNGDIAAAFASASATAEGLYTYQFASHADLEPQNCTAWFKGDSIEIWAPTQTPTMAIPAVASLLGLPPESVTLHQLRGGGGFGRRLANDSVCEVAWIAKQLGVPVKAQWSREDDMMFDYYRPGGFHSFKAALDDQGKLSGWQDHFISFGRNGQPITAANLSPQEFPVNAVGNARVTQTLLPSGMPTGYWRAPGSNAIAFAIQCFLAECSAAAGRDHLEFLLELFDGISPPAAGGFGGFGGGGLNRERAAAVTRRAAEEAGWGRQQPDGRGLGLAFHFSHQGHFAEVAEVSVDPNRRLTVHKVTVAGDIGPIVNLSGAENQVQGSVVDALSTLMGLEITFEGGQVEQKNFDRYPILRMNRAPEVEVHFIQSDNSPTGVGEPALPPAAPAICNAIFAATGHRVRTMPLTKEGYTI
jgi:isoquinoline 1-oxidoreductase beta subunit